MRAVGSDGSQAVPTGDQEWERIARSGANQQSEESEPELFRELLSFGLADATYAIPVERVREIIRLREVTPMPRVPACITGVVALRGDVVQVVDMRIRLGLEMGAPTRRSRIIVLHGDDDRVTGIAVDSVQEVLRVNEEEIDTVPTQSIGVVSELCKRGDEFVSIVDLDYMLALDEL
ncbi:MAG: purine-binding chemotaxis protein CheW [Proteobacteria bacterium]|nr:purine-binding chemotaxis protein CheW [Pseudomonadota bacterium]